MTRVKNNFIRQIFTKAGIGKIHSIQRIEIGFSNNVYSIDNKYILKIGKSAEDEENLKKDIYFCNLFKDKLPVPKIIYSDISKKLTDKIFFIYHKIQGDNLYNVWHLCSDSQRKRYIKQICNFLREINETSYEEFAQKFNINTHISWQDKICLEIETYLKKLQNKGYLKKSAINLIYEFIQSNKNVLKKEKMALTYWDLHFDNFIVSEDKIVGMLDFERTVIASIDYVLVLVRRMVNFPKKYASKNAEKFIVADNYTKLMNWYKEFYPELFDFKNLDRRIDFYSLEHCLSDMYYYPEAEMLKKELLRYIA